VYLGRLTGQEPIARKLTPDGNHHAQAKSVSITSGSEKSLEVPKLLVCSILGDIFLKLGELQVNERRVSITSL